MTNIAGLDGITGNSPIINVSDQEIEDSASVEMGGSHHQTSGINSGLLRMKEEGVMNEAILPQIRETKQKLEFAKKLAKIIPLIDKSLFNISRSMVNLVASYDANLAQSYVDKLKLTGAYNHYACIEISKYLCPEKAQLLLNQVKEQCHYYAEMSSVLREELRRDLNQKGQTLNLLKSLDHSLFDFTDFIELLTDFQLEIPEGLIERAHQSAIQICFSEHRKCFEVSSF